MTDRWSGRRARLRSWLADPLGSVGAIKLKLGALVVGGVLVTTAAILLATAAGAPRWLAVVVAGALALVTIDLLGTGLTSPLRQMAEQADRLADGLPVDEVDESARDEVGALARAFNRMAREVAHTDRVRRELVANVSHELRTPLAAMSAVVENLVDGVEEPSPDALSRLEAQAARLRRLVDQLLDLSRLDAGAVTLERRPVATASLVADAVAACGGEAEERVEVTVASDAAVLDVDPDRFRQVLVNLVGNALRHGPSGSPVTVDAARDDGEVVLRVTDRGPGIAPADAERVFERFARTDTGRAAADGGAGLGLPIARWVVTLHGGQLGVEQHAGPGARLRVALPAASAAARTPIGAPAPASPIAALPTDPAPGPARATAQETTVVTTTEPPPPAGPPVSHADGVPTSPPDGSIQLLPTPIAGFPTRSLVAIAVAAVVALLLGPLPLEGADLAAGLAMSLWLGTLGVAVVAGLERRLDAFGWTCVASGLGMAVAWSWTDAVWVLWPGTVVVALVAGLGLWGPRRAGEVLRALLVGPLLTVVTPVPIARGLRTPGGGRARQVLVPAVGVLLVLLVFGGLLAGGDAAFGALVDALVPDLSLNEYVVSRVVLALVMATLVTTYLLAARAGTVETTPWRRPVRPRRDWLAPVVALDSLLVVAIVVRAGVLFGGEERVLATTGLTYAEYAREGFGSLLALAALVVVVVGIVARVAADEDRAVRDRALGILLAATGVVVVSAVQRLSLYTAQFGLTRLRFSAFVAIGFVASVLVLVAVAGRWRPLATALPRVLVTMVGLTVLGVALVRPDAIIARQQVAAFAGTDQLDLAYVTGLSADAAPAVVTLGTDVLTRRPMAPGTADDGSTTMNEVGSSPSGGVCGEVVADLDPGQEWSLWNASRARARRIMADVPLCQGVAR